MSVSSHQAATEILNKAVADGQFTAWSFANRDGCISSFFADECEPPLEGNCDWLDSIHPVFDLASLTKPLCTNLMLRIFDKDLAATLFSPLHELLKNPCTPAGEVLRDTLKSSTLTLCDVLNHRSGVPPWMWFGKGGWHFAPSSVEARVLADSVNEQKFRERFEETITRFAAPKMQTKPAAESYSDIGYFLMARILENLPTHATQSWTDRVTNLNAELGTHFSHASLNHNASARAIPAYPYTALQNQLVPQGAFQKREFGFAHDTNASVLAQHGVVSGHAGFFGNVLDVVLAIPTLAKTQKLLLSNAKNAQNPRFVFGLDTPSNEQSAAGPLTWPLPNNQRIFGHLGYTGTMFWFSQTPEADLEKFNVLLTNRTAHRTTVGPEIAPRIVVTTRFHNEISATNVRNADTAETTYFIQSGPTAPLKPVSRNHAEETIVAHTRSTTRVWNDACLRPVPNIQILRNSVSKILWQH